MPAPASDTRDSTLVSHSLLGSREAFGLLVVRYSRSVRAVCLARAGRCSDLDDLVQESFLRAFRGLARLTDRDRFGAYLHRIAQHVCVDRLRHRKPAVSVDAVDLAAPEAPAGGIREERLDRMRHLVGTLPLLLREAVLLFYFEERSSAEIGALLGTTEAAVNQRLHRARAWLKQGLGVAEEGA